MEKMFKGFYRVIDANINRFKEGIRVVEDVLRYIFEDEAVYKHLKKLRHDIDEIINKAGIDDIQRLKERDSINDIERKNYNKSEFIRDDIFSILIANIRRAEESLRVLEELIKLKSPEISLEIKNKRYILYNIEKQIFLSYKKNYEKN